jgi:hypothetical protein
MYIRAGMFNDGAALADLVKMFIPASSASLLQL